MLVGIGIILALCLVTSTREGRAEWDERLKPTMRPVKWFATALWAAIIAGWIWPPHH